MRNSNSIGRPFLKGHIPWNKGIKRLDISGSLHPNWKGGISKTREWRLEKNRIWRKKHVEYILLKNTLRKHTLRGLGILTKQTIQLVYEDNIKKYGTLTCYLCLKPIEFGQDSLDHKQPVAKGGTNYYENLEIACKKCNCGKRDRTIDEFLKKDRMEEKMGNDKVMHPTQVSRTGGTAKQVKSGIIEGPTASGDNLNPYARKNAGNKGSADSNREK